MGCTLRVLASFLVLAAPLRSEGGDGEEMSVDRPDFTESTSTVRPGWMQMEAGVQFDSHSMAGGVDKSAGGPFPLVRIGLNDRLEFRVSTDGFQRESFAAGSITERHAGLADVAVGTKLQIAGETRWLPAFAVITALSMPTHGYFSSGGRDPFLKLCWSKSLPKGFDVGINSNIRWDTAGASTTVERAVSASFGHTLAGGFSGFWEIYRESPVSPDEPSHTVANTGLTRSAGRNVQFDVIIGHTVGARTPYWVVGMGIAVRAPLPSLLRGRE